MNIKMTLALMAVASLSACSESVDSKSKSTSDEHGLSQVSAEEGKVSRSPAGVMDPIAQEKAEASIAPVPVLAASKEEVKEKPSDPESKAKALEQTSVAAVSDSADEKISDEEEKVEASKGVRLKLKVFLEGAYNIKDGVMDAKLGANGLLPVESPYIIKPRRPLTIQFVRGTGLEPLAAAIESDDHVSIGRSGGSTYQFKKGNGGMEKLVDWIAVELRDSHDSSSILDEKPALLLKNGTVMDVYGKIGVAFENVSAGQFYVVIRHRNHLGVMSSDAVDVNDDDVIDFSNPKFAMYGDSESRAIIDGVACLKAGDVNQDGALDYMDDDSDRAAILEVIGADMPTKIVEGYHAEDVNLDGIGPVHGSWK